MVDRGGAAACVPRAASLGRRRQRVRGRQRRTRVDDQPTERAFSAGPADPEEAGWLKVPVGTALLSLSGFNTDQDGRVIATIAHRIRGDRAEYVVRVAP